MRKQLGRCRLWSILQINCPALFKKVNVVKHAYPKSRDYSKFTKEKKSLTTN